VERDSRGKIGVALLVLLVLVAALAGRAVAPSGPRAPKGKPGEEERAEEREQMVAKQAVAPSGPRAPKGKPGEEERAQEREQMVAKQIEERGVRDPKVLAAMRKVARHRFVLPEYQGEAYADHPLPIGSGQTISQPYIVAAMTELLRLKPGDRVLEIGTGSGYQAAILAELTDKVYSVEIIPELAQSAKERLKELGYTAISAENLDGFYGWPEHAPYDAIIVTCAPDHIPSPLVAQLKDGGRMVIPVGPPGFYQTLWYLERKGDELLRRNVMGVSFVPMTGGR